MKTGDQNDSGSVYRVLDEAVTETNVKQM